MTLAEVLQLYAPLVGIVGLAFWTGVLSERVKRLAQDVQELKADSTVSGSPAVIRLEEQFSALTKTVDRLVRAMEGVQRQFGNLMKDPPHPMDLGDR